MTTDPPRTPGIDWPVTVLGLGVLAAVVTIVVTGHNVDDLVRGLVALFSATGALAGIGAYVRSTQAAKQTNGDLEDRMHQAVAKGITTALQQAASRPRPAKRHDPPTKLQPPGA